MFQDVDENQLQDEPEVTTPETDEEAAPPSKAPRGWIGLGAVALLGVGITAFMYFKTGPAKAEANESAQKTISAFLGTGQKSMATLQAMLDKTARTVDQISPTADTTPAAALPKNPFYKPEPEQSAVTAAPAQDDARTAAIARAGELKLQSILFSGSRQGCMIDNRYREVGDTVGTFTVERITPASVIVREGAYRFELKAQR